MDRQGRRRRVRQRRIASKSPKKPDSQKFFVSLRVITIVCAAATAIFVGLLIYNGMEYSHGDAAYDQVRSMLRSDDKSTEGAKTSAGSPGRSSEMDFAPLQAVNKDVAGWILAEGRAIDYPVVRGDDNDYYLTHLFNHEQNKLGSIFMDYRNHGDFSDKNTVIYGHNMKDGSMFASLAGYKDQSYYDSFPTMVLYTPNGDYAIELFAGIVADGNYEFVRFAFEDDKNFLDYINALKEKSTFKSDTVIKADDQIVTLCTCSYEFNNARYALLGKLKYLQ